MSGYEWLTAPPVLEGEVVKELYKRYLEEIDKAARYDQAILDLYDYGTIRAPLYLKSLHSIRRDLVEGQKIRRQGLWGRSYKR